MSVSVRYGPELEIIETLATGVPYGSAVAVTLTPALTKTTYTDVTVPPVTKAVTFDKAMSAGAGTIDLTSLVGVNGAAVTFTGLRVQLAKFKNKSANANNITITFGASNGFTGFGSAFSLTLAPGAEVLLFCNDGTADVDATHKTLDLSGTLAQTLECTLVAG